MKIFEVVEPENKFNKELRQRLRGRHNFPLSSTEPNTEFDPLDKIDLKQLNNVPANQKKSVNKSTERFDTGNEIGDKFFKDFDTQARQQILKLGLTPIYYKDTGAKNKWVVGCYTSNNIYVFINSSNDNEKVWIGGLNDPIKISSVGESLKDAGFVKTDKKSTGSSLTNYNKPGQNKFQSMIEAIDVIEGLGPDFNQRGRKSSKKINSDSPRKFYTFMATNILNAWGYEQSYAVSRGSLGDAFDRFDNLILLGYTREGLEATKQKQKTDFDANKAKNKKEGAWREHVVPGDYIVKMCFEICEKNLNQYKRRFDRAPEDLKIKTLKEMIDVINRNLAIVICSVKEREYIDFTMGWQTTMPPGWKNGDNILARFIQCTGYPNPDSKGIPVYSVKTGQRISENI